MSQDYVQERRRKRAQRRRKKYQRNNTQVRPRIKDTRGRLRKVRAVEPAGPDLEAARRWSV